LFHYPIKNGGYHLKNMVNIFKETGKGVIALMRVPKEETFKYGIANVSVPDSSSKHLLINDMVEKPDPNDAPSDLAIVGRYVLPNKTMFLLDSTQPGAGGEIQLTDAIKQIANSDGMIGYIVEDEIHDMGNPLGFIKANISFGLDDPEIGDKLREYILNQMK
jgi:UTP--glucose-1-phosphate uridylyltransferase